MAELKFSTLEEMPLLAISLESTQVISTGSWRHVRPVYVQRTSPCEIGCPAGEKIPEYFELLRQRKYEEAWRKVLEDNPLPGVMGRVCYHPCESSCNRAQFDSPIAIHLIERFVADKNFSNTTPMPLLESRKRERVAIVGSGPSGLSCAYQLARRGYNVTIYEAEAKPGGMLRYGIPRYRLPRRVLDKEIGDILRLGVELRLNARVGENISWSELKAYDAIYLAVGAQRSRRLGVEGEELDGIRTGVDFLREINSGAKPTMSSKVVVIGGGNTAIDAARSSRRLGAEVTIVYRRTRAEMPAVPEEIEEAEKEGVEFLFLAAPVRFHGENGRVKKIEVQRMALGEPDASGRRRPVPVASSNFFIEAGTVLTAIGEEPDLSLLSSSDLSMVLREEGGRICVDEHQMTGVPGIFAGGDAATNPLGTVVNAIRAGKNAALAIHEYLGWKKVENSAPGEVVEYKDINLAYFVHEQRARGGRLAVAEGIKSFREVNRGLSESQALREVDRCFSCGTCIHCDVCMDFCPDVAISKDAAGEYVIDYNHCKGCGICVAECPREAMALSAELAFATAGSKDSEEQEG